jgi:hypothetical protein
MIVLVTCATIFFIVSDNIADTSTNLPPHIDGLCNSPNPVSSNWPEEVDLSINTSKAFAFF